MKTMQFRLEFPLERIQEHVVTQLVKDFDVSPNVLAANIDARKGGWLLLGLSGDQERVDRALAWIRSKGIAATEQ